MNSVQDFIKDKTITVANGTVKTGKIIATTSSSAVKSAVSTATDITVRRAPGVLKSTDDLAGTAAKRAGVETVRGIRTANQIRHSVNNRKYAYRYKANVTKAKNSRGLKALKFQKKAEKQRRKINEAKSFSFRKSSKSVINNKIRRQLYEVKNKPDISSKAIGTTSGAMWTVYRYRKQIKLMAVKTVSLITGAISSLVAVVISLPAVVATVISMMPVIVVVIVVAVVLAPFCDMTYHGRIGQLIDNIDELNQIYGIEFDPIEMLCITDVLGWQDADYEDYEIVCSLAVDQKKGNDVSFEQIQDNVFSKYNPAKKYNANTIYSDNENTGWYYYSHSGIDMSIIIGGSDKKNINYKDMMTVYREYSKLKKTEEKEAYGSEANIAAMKQKCNDRYAYNEEVYHEYLSTMSNFQAGDSELGNKIAKVAISQEGKRYWWGKSGPDYYDCSGLVIYAHEQSGVPTSGKGRWTTKILCSVGVEITRDQLQPGDIILFSTDKTFSKVHHVGIYIGNNTMVHASGSGSTTTGQYPDQCVKESSLDEYYYAKQIYQFRRLY